MNQETFTRLYLKAERKKQISMEEAWPDLYAAIDLTEDDLEETKQELAKAKQVIRDLKSQIKIIKDDYRQLERRNKELEQAYKI